MKKPERCMNYSKVGQRPQQSEIMKNGVLQCSPTNGTLHARDLICERVNYLDHVTITSRQL